MSKEKFDEITELSDDIYNSFQHIARSDSRNIAESLYNDGWRKQSEAIDEAIQQKVDVEERKKVQDALYESCFDRKVTTIIEKQVVDRFGDVHDVKEVRTTVIPADVRAQKFYLTNRHPARWKEKVTVEQERPEELASFIPVPERMIIPEEGAPDEPTDG